jgi:pyruvate/2-oxoglutarate dehydrogenase complex dihydrolipoamide dehydrogenase (E3) component
MVNKGEIEVNQRIETSIPNIYADKLEDAFWWH